MALSTGRIAELFIHGAARPDDHLDRTRSWKRSGAWDRILGCLRRMDHCNHRGSYCLQVFWPGSLHPRLALCRER